MTTHPLPSRARVYKAHGAGNSFVVATDEYGLYDPSTQEVATLCSPAFGIGADGFIRAVKNGELWFMDYRNADGSLAQMCGNGVRVFVDHLRRENLISLPVGASIHVETRGGIKTVMLIAEENENSDALYRVDMGPASSPARATITVGVPGLAGQYAGIWVDMPNPHTVIALHSDEELYAAQLSTVDVAQVPEAMRPTYDPAPREGTNLELVVDLGDEEEAGHIRMRVLERGVGETQACGTGCCAAALATALRRGPQAPTHWIVDVPGGRVSVDLDGVIDWGGDTPTMTSASVILTGPATRIAEATIR